jgi:hypothetical protein
MLPHGCWRAPRGCDEVGPRLDQSLFGEREEHHSATRDSGSIEIEFCFYGQGRIAYCVQHVIDL